MISDTAFAEFLGECDEIKDRIAAHLALIEKNEFDASHIDSLYRDFHTLKGSSNLYRFKQLGAISHAMESALEPVRASGSSIPPAVLDALFESVAIIEKIIASLRLSKQEPESRGDLDLIIPKLIESQAEMAQPREGSLTDLVTQMSSPVFSVEPESVVSPEPKNLPNVSTAQAVAKKSEALDSSSVEGNQTIRVNVSILDKLMNLIGEMVLVRNQILQFSNKLEDLDFLKLSQKLNGVTSELQEEVMRTRMQPIGTILEKFHRVVRDLSKDLNKKIDLQLEGADTLLDKSLIEAVKDPLTHLVRNSCDHGIESVEKRRASGKSETGRVQIRAYHEGGQVHIEIIDDGKGLDREKIIGKAIERGITTSENASKLTDREVFKFIFEPGFSTADQVTTVSGRGVGMDVVRTNIERIGGTVELESVPGKGAKVRVKIPLTLAIIPALVVNADGMRFAIPQIKLVELVKAFVNQSGSSQESGTCVEFLQGRPMFRLRGNLLPLIDIRQILSLKSREFKADQEINIVVLNSDGKVFGLIVDEIQDTTDIVVKPLTKFLKALSVYSGATIMGDGSVALIMDVTGLAQKATLTTERRSEGLSDSEKAAASSSDSQELLLFKTAAQGKYAMALCLVQRLEEFDRSTVEFSGGQMLIRYRESALPLIDLNQFFGFKSESLAVPSDRPLSVVVVQKRGRQYGLVVDEILDIVSVDREVDDNVRDRSGILGNILLPTEIAVVIDPLEIVETTLNKMGHSSDGERAKFDRQGFNAAKTKILLAEDSTFFRKLMIRALEQVGFDVTAVGDGREALNVLEKEGANFSVIVSDIEMPHLNGYELAREVRRRDALKSVPMVAVTTKFSDEDRAQGMSAGFNRYFEKLNQDEFVSGICEVLEKRR